MQDDEYDPLEAFQPRWSPQRVLSLAVVLGYVLVAVATGQVSTLWRVALPSVIPMLCIWYPGAMASISSGALGWWQPNYETPEGLVQGLAWVVLLAPVWIVALAAVLVR